MLKFKHPVLIVLAGLVWMAGGIFLLNLGLKLIVSSGRMIDYGLDGPAPLLRWAAQLFGSGEAASLLLITMALFIGYFKGRFVLTKSAHRAIKRIRAHQSPMSLHRIYSPPFLLLILGMIGLGMLIKYFNIPNDIRGGIDAAIGAALISGSLAYFRLANKDQPVADNR